MPARRYATAGPVYDALSLESLLYRGPRRRLLELVDLAPGATVLDLGCGTGLSFPGILAAIGSDGRLIGLDSSASMLARAGRRASASGSRNVVLLEAEAADLLGALDREGLDPAALDAVLATYVLAVLDDDRPVWDALDRLAVLGPLRVGIADMGVASTAAPVRAAYGVLARMGGADPTRRPWETLLRRGTAVAHEEHLSGHVHVTVADYRRTLG